MRRELVVSVMLALGCAPKSEDSPAEPDNPVPAPAEVREVSPEGDPPSPPTSAIDGALADCEASRPQGPRYPELRSDVAPALDATWGKVVPLVDTLATVREKMGPPREEEDIASFSGPYEGDDKAAQPLLIYDHPGPWDVYVYLVRSDFSTRDDFDAAVHDRVGSIELLPEGSGPDLSKVEFGPPFEAADVLAADAGWVDHRAPSGLTYSVYGSESDPGRLNRVAYGPSDCQRKAAAGSP